MGRDWRSTRSSGVSSVASGPAPRSRDSRGRGLGTRMTRGPRGRQRSRAPTTPPLEPRYQVLVAQRPTGWPPSDPGGGEPPDRRRRTAHEVRDRRSRPPSPIQRDQLVAVTVDPSGTTGSPVDARGDQPASHRPGRHPVALRQVAQAQPPVPIELTELLCGRTGASATGPRAPIDAPAGKPPVDQAGAASQLVGDLHRGVPPLGVELPRDPSPIGPKIDGTRRWVSS